VLQTQRAGRDPALSGFVAHSSIDDLTPLLTSRSWVKRRVDQIEFLDLTTVRRKITFTLNLTALDELMEQRPTDVIPLGWFVPWGNAAAVLGDGSQRVVPHITSQATSGSKGW
jgi:hypothetical protein